MARDLVRGMTFETSADNERLVVDVTPPFARARRQRAAGAQFNGPRNDV